jgi:hypothetical protein
MHGMYLLKKCILSFKWPRDGVHTFDTSRWYINIAIILFHASFIYLWYVCNNVTCSSYGTYNTCVPYNMYGPYHQMGENCTYGACGTYGAYGEYGTCSIFCVCGTFVADVECGTYGTHVPYLQMVQISMNFL